MKEAGVAVSVLIGGWREQLNINFCPLIPLKLSWKKKQERL